jgi:hypothetical protein
MVHLLLVIKRCLLRHRLHIIAQHLTLRHFQVLELRVEKLFQPRIPLEMTTNKDNLQILQFLHPLPLMDNLLFLFHMDNHNNRLDQSMDIPGSSIVVNLLLDIHRQ